MSRIDIINARIASAQAKVVTLQELCGLDAQALAAAKIDIVCMSFSCDISGSAAVLVVPVAGRGVFTRAEEIVLNGITGHPGPAPNERLGVVDTMLFADERRSDSEDDGYDGAALFQDLLHGNAVEVECISVEKSVHHRTFTLKEAEFARFYVYNAPLPRGAGELEAVREMLVPGTRIALDGSQGIVVGTGTRNRPGALSLSLTADMHDMDPALFAAANGRPQHVVAMALAPRNDFALAQLADWARAQGDSLFTGGAAGAAALHLKTSIEAGRFELAETGANALHAEI